MTNNIEVYRGNSELLRVHCMDSDGGDIDLTGVTDIRFTVFKNEDGVPLLTKDLVAGISVVAPESDGRFDVTIDSGDTSKLWGVGYYRIDIDLDGESYTLHLQDADSVEPFPHFKFL